MKRLYQAPKSDNFYVESLMGQDVGSPVNNVVTEAPQRQGGDFMPL